jgi:hypothetical protein
VGLTAETKSMHSPFLLVRQQCSVADGQSTSLAGTFVPSGSHRVHHKADIYY